MAKSENSTNGLPFEGNSDENSIASSLGSIFRPRFGISVTMIHPVRFLRVVLQVIIQACKCITFIRTLLLVSLFNGLTDAIGAGLRMSCAYPLDFNEFSAFFIVTDFENAG